MKRAYFIDVELENGEWVTIVYESDSRRGSASHRIDFYCATKDLKIADKKIDFSYAYILNKKNKYEQMFGDSRIIDLR